MLKSERVDWQHSEKKERSESLACFGSEGYIIYIHSIRFRVFFNWFVLYLQYHDKILDHVMYTEPRTYKEIKVCQVFSIYS